MSNQNSRRSKLDPIAETQVPTGWSISDNTSQNMGKLLFSYDRAEHPALKPERSGEVSAIEVYGNDGTYTIKSKWLTTDLWTDDVWRVVEMFDDCFYCATNRFDEHDEDCKTLFEIVTGKVEEQRLKVLLQSSDGVGEKITERIVDRYKTPRNVSQATERELKLIPHVGHETVGNVKKLVQGDIRGRELPDVGPDISQLGPEADTTTSLSSKQESPEPDDSTSDLDEAIEEELGDDVQEEDVQESEEEESEEEEEEEWECRGPGCDETWPSVQSRHSHEIHCEEYQVWKDEEEATDEDQEEEPLDTEVVDEDEGEEEEDKFVCACGESFDTNRQMTGHQAWCDDYKEQKKKREEEATEAAPAK